MGKTFWTLMALLGAAAIHIAAVLFLPSEMFRAYAALGNGASGSNSFVVLQPEARRYLLPALRGPGVAAYCAIDLSKGTVTMAIRPPKTYWSLAVFAGNGKQVYALNERQADTDQIAIDFRRAPTLFEQVMGAGEDEAVTIIENAAWSVELNDARAYAVLWIPYGDPLQAGLGQQAIKTGSCRLKANPQG